MTDQDALDWLDGIAGGLLNLTEDNVAYAQRVQVMLQTSKPAPAPPLAPGYLSPHFTVDELTRSDTATAQGIDNTPDDDELVELKATAELLEKVRAACGGNPVFVSSGFRCPQLNAAVGGASDSAHLYGCAADFTVPDFGDVLDVCHAIEPHLAAWGVDQLIDESGGGWRWVHLGRACPGDGPPRGQCLTINASGTTTSGIA